MCRSSVSARLGARLALALALLSGLVAAAADDADEDRRLVGQLEKIRLLKADVKEGRFDTAAADAAYRREFAAYGIDVGELTVDQAATRIRNSSLRVRMAVALDDWASLCPNHKVVEQLVAIARAADPDPWRNRLREALQKKDLRVLNQLAAGGDLAGQHPITVVLLADALARAGNVSKAVVVLQQAQWRHPADFWINHQLASCLTQLGPPRWQEAVRFFTAALALRPENPGVLLNLGVALEKNGQCEEALTAFRQAIRLRPDFAEAYDGLGRVLSLACPSDEAIAAFRKAIALKPNYTRARRNLGEVLMQQGKLEEAITAFRAAITVDPQDAPSHLALGDAMRQKGRLDEAIACYQKAIRLDPELLGAFVRLGHALADLGRLDEAIAAYRESLKVDPPGHHSVMEAHFGLANIFARKRMFKEAAAGYREAVRFDPHNAEIRIALGRAERLARLASLESKLPAFIKGDFRPRNNDERLGLAEWCRIKKHYRAAAQLFADAFTAEPKLGEDVQNEHRYQAAALAVLAGSGKGKDAAGLDDKEQARWRKQALTWLRADLVRLNQQLESGKRNERDFIPAFLQYWRRDPALAGIRDAQALAKLPAHEQEAYRQLWTDVAALLKRAADD